MRRKQSLCGDGVQGAVAITGRAKNVFGGKSVAPLHVALICIVWAGRALQFALKPFCGASAPLLRDVCLAPRRMRSLSALLCAPAALQGHCGCTCVAVHCSCSAPVPDDRQPRHAQACSGRAAWVDSMRGCVAHTCPIPGSFTARIQATCAIYHAMACSSVSESYLMAECRRE